MRVRRHPLRQPQHPHLPGDRCVPVRGCGCVTCQETRNLRDVRAAELAGEIMGERDYGTCPCGRALDEYGRCVAQEQCVYFAEAVRR